MAQALVETIFDICYLVGVIAAGIIMMTKGRDNPLVKQFGLMAVLLGAGDSFHLVPRMYALWTTGLEANAAALGIGKLITSVTMTIFYLILYYIWRERYSVQGRGGLTAAMWGLTIVRIALCLLPQNAWLSYQQPLLWGILRNIPFAIMGVLIIVLFAQEVKKGQRQNLPLHAAGSYPLFWLLYPGGAVWLGSAAAGHADDTQNPCLCVGGADGVDAV